MQIVAEAQRLTSGSSVALVPGRHRRNPAAAPAGWEEFPPELDAALAVGPEIPREGLPRLRSGLDEELPGTVMAPAAARAGDRVLLAVDAPEQPLLTLARKAPRRSRERLHRRVQHDAPAQGDESGVGDPAEPPTAGDGTYRGGMLAGNVLPGSGIGGDWFDCVETRGQR
jgi:hypothetical protein